MHQLDADLLQAFVERLNASSWRKPEGARMNAGGLETGGRRPYRPEVRLRHGGRG